MKPLVNTSVYGLVPLPQLPESKVGVRDHGSGAQPAPTFEASLEHNEELTCCHCKAQRKLISPHWLSIMWRQREADR
jgi:hypothetical protein